MNAQNVHNMHVQTWHMQYVCGDIVHCTYIVCVHVCTESAHMCTPDKR